MKELPRRLWHIFGGVSLAIAGLLLPRQIFLPALCSVTIAFLIFELIRLGFPQLNCRFITCFRALIREREASTLTSSAYLLIAACIVFIVCDKSIAVMAVTFVAVGDPAAGMARDKWKQARGWGRRKSKGKSLEGSGACLAACLVVGGVLAAIIHVAWWVAVTGAIFATLMEFLSLPLNDNLTMPLASAGAMSLIGLLGL